MKFEDMSWNELVKVAREMNEQLEAIGGGGVKGKLMPGAAPVSAEPPAPPDCPFPCGWKMLHTIAVQDAAYLAKVQWPEDEEGVSVPRETMMRSMDNLIQVCRAMLKASHVAAQAQHAISGYTHTVPDDCETLHWRGNILSMNELASVAQPAVGEEIHIHIEGQDVLTLPLASSGMDAPRFVVHVPAQAQQPVSGADGLPPLPQGISKHGVIGHDSDVYTDAHMRDYARAALAQQEADNSGELYYKLACFIDHATGGRLSKLNWPLEALKRAHDENVENMVCERLAEEKEFEQDADKADEGLLNALKGLLEYAERLTCLHENTRRGGVIWEICDDCGAKWADDRGGKPASEWPQEIRIARALIEAPGKDANQ